MPNLVLFVSNDLMFGAGITRHCEQQGRKMQMIKSSQLREMMDQQPQQATELGESTSHILVDLTESDDVVSIATAFAQHHAVGVRKIAFGPHVNVGILQAAQNAGFEAFPRSRMQMLLPQMFSEPQ
ncbi:MAG: hypothetical protein AAFP90_18635 [Planctomycetota bacterium]